MDQTIRNKLRGAVTQCRKLLEDSTAQALQGRFGIYAAPKKGEVQIEDEARMVHLTDEDRACRHDLLDHLEHIQAIGYKASEALEQLVREIAFTHLNRLCAYKMMESRGLIREAVSRGLKSQGFSSTSPTTRKTRSSIMAASRKRHTAIFSTGWAERFRRKSASSSTPMTRLTASTHRNGCWTRCWR